MIRSLTLIGVAADDRAATISVFVGSWATLMRPKATVEDLWPSIDGVKESYSLGDDQFSC